jgi:hypothetical protein
MFRSSSGVVKTVDQGCKLAAGDIIVLVGDITKLGNLMLEFNLVPEVPPGFNMQELQHPGPFGLAAQQLHEGGKEARFRYVLVKVLLLYEQAHVCASYQLF